MSQQLRLSLSVHTLNNIYTSDSTNKSTESKEGAVGGQPPVYTRSDYRDTHHDDRSTDRSDTDDDRIDSVAAMESEGDVLDRGTGERDSEPVSPITDRDVTAGATGERAASAYDDAMNLLSGLADKNKTADSQSLDDRH